MSRRRAVAKCCIAKDHKPCQCFISFTQYNTFMRLLIIEDEQKLARAIQRMFELKSFAVDLMFDSDDGLAMALDEPYHAIIIDWMLPGSLDGIGVCKALREQGKQMPILLLTARDKVTHRLEGLESGADDYMVKPFAMAELLVRVRNLLRRPPQLLNDVLHTDDLTLDTRSMTVQRTGQLVTVTPREFALLEYLLRHKGHILTKEMIIAQVWNYDADVLPNTVEAVIRRLRIKIDRAFPAARPLITTVYGFGYRIEA